MASKSTLNLDGPDNLLDDAYDAALQVEAIAAARGISWSEARQFIYAKCQAGRGEAGKK